MKTKLNEVEKLILITKKNGRELAPILNTTEATISRYKKGLRFITVETLKKWCKILQIDIKTLF